MVVLNIFHCSLKSELLEDRVLSVLLCLRKTSSVHQMFNSLVQIEHLQAAPLLLRYATL